MQWALVAEAAEALEAPEAPEAPRRLHPSPSGH